MEKKKAKVTMDSIEKGIGDVLLYKGNDV